MKGEQNMLEIGINKRTLYINGEKVEISKELADWVAKYTNTVVTFNVKGE